MVKNNNQRLKSALKVGLIGCGRIGAHTSDYLRKTLSIGWLPLSHAEAITSIPHLKLIALCDTNKKQLTITSSTYNVRNCYTNYQELILRETPDILSIATRTDGRCTIIEFATNHGVKGIHVEKPFSRNMIDCYRAFEEIKKNKVSVTYGTTRRFMDVYKKAKEIIDTESLGKIRQITIEHGRETLLWSHPHSVDLLIFFSACTDVDYVQATCSTKTSLSNNVLDDDPMVENALIKFRNGIYGLITSASGMNTRITCSNGTLTVVGDGEYIIIQKPKDNDSIYFQNTEKISIKPTMSGTQHAFCELSAAILEHKNLSITPAEIILSQRILFAIAYSSLQKGRRLKLSELPNDFTITGKFGSLFA